MLSRTGGLQKHSHLQGCRRDVQSKLGTPCPMQKQRGRCKRHERELAIHQQVAQEKEAQLLKKATAMYTLQMDLLADMDANGADGDDPELQQMRQLLLGSGSGSGGAAPSKEEAIERLVEELKQEPEYVHWNLDAAVAERMVQLRVAPCQYSHRGEALQSLKRARHMDSTEEANLLRAQQHEATTEAQNAMTLSSSSPSPASPTANGQKRPQSSGERQARALATFSAERAKVFATLTPLQRCVVCLLWQRTVRLPQQVLCANVRAKVEAEVEAEMARDAADGELDEEALDAFLASPQFEDRVKAAEAALVDVAVFLPALGVLDLASLPQMVAYLSRRKATYQPITSSTLAYFSATPADLFAVKVAGPKGVRKAVVLTEKELDLSAPARAVELVEAVEWALYLYSCERRLTPYQPSPAATTKAPTVADEKAAFMKLSHRAGRVVLRSLSLRNCQLTLADGLVASLHKSGLGQHLLALDLSDNRLHSLRFLFAMRAHFAERLLRLSLKNNLITRKPEYQEQVRKSLPRLTSLDGEPIRRPPLRFPKCQSASYTAQSLQPSGTTTGTTGSGTLTQKEYDLVMDTVARLFYIWETRRIPHTQLERRVLLQEAKRARLGDGEEGEGEQHDEEEEDALLPMEEEMNEDNFPHRYLHPSSTFTFTASPGLTLFDAEVMKLDREVELDDTFMGVRLNAHDLRDARVFDVAVRNSSRNLLMGRPALQRFGRGCDNCYLAYQYSIYPERFEVDHGLAGAVVSVDKLPLDLPGSQGGKKMGFGTGAVGGSATARDRFAYVVSLHSVMTWRLPSMRGGQCFEAAYDRVLTLSPKLLAAQNYAWERRRSPKLVLCNDQLLLRPVASDEEEKVGNNTSHAMGGCGSRGIVVFSEATAARVARLVVQFGLEACKDGEAFVRAVMERTVSSAAEEAALDALVFGPLPAATGEEANAEGEKTKKAGTSDEPAYVREANAAVCALLSKHIASVQVEERQPRRAKKGKSSSSSSSSPAASEKGPAPVTAAGVHHIFSLLDRTSDSDTAMATHGSSRTANGRGKWGGSALHAVPLPLLNSVTRTLNEHYSLPAFTEGRKKVHWA